MTEREAQFAVLKVAFLLTAVDGSVDERELRVYDRLAACCEEVDAARASLAVAEAKKAVRRMVGKWPRGTNGAGTALRVAGLRITTSMRKNKMLGNSSARRSQDKVHGRASLLNLGGVLMAVCGIMSGAS